MGSLSFLRALLLLASPLLSTSTLRSYHQSEFWFWGYGGKPLVPPSIFEVMKAGAATGVIGGYGHAVGDHGAVRVPAGPPQGGGAYSKWIAAQIAQAHEANMTFKALIGGCTLGQLRALVFNETAMVAATKALVADQQAFGHDGFNFDLEMGGFNATDETAFADLIIRLQKAMPAGVEISACIGDARFALASPATIRKATTATPPQLYDMGTYSADNATFGKQLTYGLGLVTRENLVVGLSASTDSWKPPGPSVSDLRVRFSALASANITRVAIFGGSYEFLPAYAPFLKEFVATGREMADV